MRFVLGFLSGLAGLIVGWLGLAILVLSIYGSGNAGGIAMSAIFQIGPIGGLLGLIIGVLLFINRRKAPQETG